MSPKLEADGERERVHFPRVNAYDVLGIDKLPISRFEKLLIRSICRFDLLENKFAGSNGEILSQYTIADIALNERMHKLVYDEFGHQREYGLVVENIMGETHERLFDSDIAVFLPIAANGNFLQRLFQGDSACINTALAAMLVAKVYYQPFLNPVELVPFNVRSIARGRSTPWHDNYGVVYNFAGKRYAMINYGITVPLEDIVHNDKPKKDLTTYYTDRLRRDHTSPLSRLSPENGARFSDAFIPHFKSLLESYKKRYMRSSPDGKIKSIL